MLFRRCPLTAFFCLACAFSWLLWAPLWLPALGLSNLPQLRCQHALGSWGPMLAAICVCALTNGRRATADLLRRMVLWRGRGRLLALAVLAPLVLLAWALLGVAMLRGTPFSIDGLARSAEFPQLSALVLLAYNLVTFGVGEELGWRGFALPRLQSRHSAWVATAMLTAGWATWHVPLFFYRPGYVDMGAAGIAGWLLSLLTGAVLLSWLYNDSQGSVLVVALFHAAMDVAFTSDLHSPLAFGIAGALLTLWGLGVLWVDGPGCLSRRGKMVQGPRDAVQRLVRP
jgi:uncharacterized protein